MFKPFDLSATFEGLIYMCDFLFFCWYESIANPLLLNDKETNGFR